MPCPCAKKKCGRKVVAANPMRLLRGKPEQPIDNDSKLIQLLRIAKIILADSTSAAVFAKIPCGLDQFYIFFGIGFDKSFFL